jgi:aminopeptidase N
MASPEGAAATMAPDAAMSMDQSPPLDEGKDVGPCGHARAWAKLIDAERRGPDGSGGPREGDADTDITHYFLDIEIIPEYSGSTVTNVRVQGVSTLSAQAAVDGLTTFTIDLAANLTVNSVTGNVSSWSRVADTIVVTLDDTYDTGESFQAAASYQGYPQDGGWGSFRWWIRNDNLAVGTLSEPFYAKYWWPCKDALMDKATMQMHCTVPNGMVVASNGVLEGTDPVGIDRTKFRWREDYPMITYLASLAITNYQCYNIVYNYNDGQPRTMPVWCYLYPDHWDFTNTRPLPVYKTGCDELVTMLTKLGERFGLYPFLLEKYGVAETGGSGGLGANMEHQTCTSMYQVNNYSDIMCHELSHQWWGDEVTCETWYDIWLNEGFASYAEPLYRELKPGGGFSSYMSRVLARRPSNPDAQVYRTNIGSTGAIFSTNDVYNKGCWVLHMLRHVMGDAAFFQALADYRAAFADDSATTAEFTTSFSTSFGQDLSWFVNEWVMHAGSPDYEYAWKYQNIGGQHHVLLRLAQTQQDRGYPLFTMPVDVRVSTPVAETHVVSVANRVHTFDLTVAGVPTPPGAGQSPVKLDPGSWILTHSVAEFCPGDMNKDGAIDGRDIQAMVNTVLNPASSLWYRGDMDWDGDCDLNDVPLFVIALLSPGPCPTY